MSRRRESTIRTKGNASKDVLTPQQRIHAQQHVGVFGQCVRCMTDAQLADVIEGRTRLGDTEAEQIQNWNLAIDEETERRLP